jgi:hypothetical protein
MARTRFKIRELGGGDLREAKRFFRSEWELLQLCEAAGLYKRQAEVIIWWAKELTTAQISTMTGVERRHVGRTFKSGLARLAEHLEAENRRKAEGDREIRAIPAGGATALKAAADILWLFRNREHGADHGPKLQGTRPGNFREVGVAHLVIADDLVEWEPSHQPEGNHPGLEVILRRLRLD